MLFYVIPEEFEGVLRPLLDELPESLAKDGDDGVVEVLTHRHRLRLGGGGRHRRSFGLGSGGGGIGLGSGGLGRSLRLWLSCRGRLLC